MTFYERERLSISVFFAIIIHVTVFFLINTLTMQNHSYFPKHNPPMYVELEDTVVMQKRVPPKNTEKTTPLSEEPTETSDKVEAEKKNDTVSQKAEQLKVEEEKEQQSPPVIEVAQKAEAQNVPQKGDGKSIPQEGNQTQELPQIQQAEEPKQKTISSKQKEPQQTEKQEKATESMESIENKEDVPDWVKAVKKGTYQEDLLPEQEVPSETGDEIPQTFKKLLQKVDSTAAKIPVETSTTSKDKPKKGSEESTAFEEGLPSNIPISWEEPEKGRTLLRQVVPHITAKDFAPLEPRPFEFVVTFQVDENGRLRNLHINPSTVYTTVENKIKQTMLITWKFEPKLGASLIKGKIPFIIEVR